MPSSDDCHRKALDLLARRPHFCLELATKLARRGFPAEEIETVMAGLTDQGLLDDYRYALELARGALRRKGFGPVRVRAELERRGVAAEISVSVAHEVFPDAETELEQARAVAGRWQRSGSQSRTGLGRHLQRKGYSQRVILQILEAEHEA